MGAVGSALSTYFFNTYKDNFYIVATGARAKRLKNEGIKVNDDLFFPQIMTPENKKHIDLLIVTVKNYSLDTAMEDIKQFIDKDTIILPLLNGITATDRLKKFFPSNKILYGIIIRTDANRTSNIVTFSTTGEIQIGYENNNLISKELLEVQYLLRNTGLNVNIYEDMKKMLWRKWLVNIGANQVSVESSAEFKYFGKVPEIIELMKISMDEILKIAKCENVNLTEKDRDDIINILINYPPYKKTSMLQDIEASRPTEIDYFAGTVVELGKKHNIPTPVNYTLYLAIKAKEKVYLDKKEHNLTLV